MREHTKDTSVFTQPQLMPQYIAQTNYGEAGVIVPTVYIMPRYQHTNRIEDTLLQILANITEHGLP